MSATSLAAFIARCRVLCQPRKHLSDAELLERFTRRRDADAFTQLLERYAPLVWGVCRRILPREADCEDAFQAVFLALLRRPAAIDPNQALGAWLHTVAVRVAHRTRAQSRRSFQHSEHPEPTMRGDVADEVSSRELIQAVDEEIERLPAAVRAPLILCCLEGRTRDEAAGMLGCSVAAIKGRLERGRELLRRRLNRRGVELPAAFLVLGLTTERIRAALWAKTMQSVLHTAAPALVSLAEAGVSAATLGKGKLFLAVLLLASSAAGAAGMLLTERPVVAPLLPQEEKIVAEEPKKPEAPQIHMDRHGDPLPDGAIARLGTVRWRHGFFVHTLAYSPDGKKIAAVGAGRAITLWNAATGKEIHQFPNEGQPIGVAFSPDGKSLVTVGRNNIVNLWDVETGKRIRRWTCQVQVTCGRFSPDGKTLAAADVNGTIYFWDRASGTELRRIDSRQGYLNALAFSPDGKMLASGGSDGTVCLWDPRSGREEHRIKGHVKVVYQIFFSPDGKLLASLGEEGSLRLWEPMTGRLRRTLLEKQEKLQPYGPLAFSPDGAILAGGNRDGTIRLWDVASGEEKLRWRAASVRVFALAFSPDGKTLASAAAMESDIRFWDPATDREKNPSEEHHGTVHTLRFSPDGTALLSIARDRRILQWDCAANKPRQLFSWTSENMDTFALSPDGATLAVGTFSSGEVRLWDLQTGKIGRLLGKDCATGIWAITFSPDGRLVASGDDDRIIHIWDVASGNEIRRIKDFKNRVVWLQFSPDSKALAVGTTTLGKSTGEATLRLWDVASGKERFSFDCHIFTEAPLVFSPDGKMLASGHGTPGDPPREAAIVRLWDMTTGKEVRRHAQPGVEIGAIAFSPDGKLIVSGSTGRGLYSSIDVWEAATGSLVRHFEGHHSGVDSLAVAPDGLTVASGAGDSTILLWDITGRRPDGRWHAKPLPPYQLDSCWKALANEDAAKAYDAVWALVAAPEQAVPFLKKHLPPVPRPDAKNVARLIADLDSDDFAVRQKATEELTKLGDAVTSALGKALERKPTLEMRRRIQQLLDQTRDWTAERLRDHRAIEALEHIGTRQAKEALQALAEGASEARRTEEAKTALQRLNR